MTLVRFLVVLISDLSPLLFVDSTGSKLSYTSMRAWLIGVF